MDLAVLTDKLPAAWQGIISMLQSEARPREKVEAWLQDNMHSQYGTGLCWCDLLEALAQEEPIVFKNQLSLYVFHVFLLLQS